MWGISSIYSRHWAAIASNNKTQQLNMVNKISVLNKTVENINGLEWMSKMKDKCRGVGKMMLNYHKEAYCIVDKHFNSKLIPFMLN